MRSGTFEPNTRWRGEPAECLAAKDKGRIVARDTAGLTNLARRT